MKAAIKGHGAIAGCGCCSAVKSNLHSKYDLCFLFSLPWQERDHAEMSRLLQLQLIKVRVDTLDAKVKLVDSLRWLTKHPWGRRVKPYHGQRFGLRAMDKLCCGGSIGMDLHSLDGLSVPFEVTFFRQKKNTPFTGIPVMWDVEGVHEFGIKHFRIDIILYTVDLGLAQRLVGPSLICLLRNDIYQLEEDTVQGTLERGALHMRKDLQNIIELIMCEGAKG